MRAAQTGQDRVVCRPQGGADPVFESLEPRLLFTAVPLITEFLASNSGGLQDEDGATSDWIELYNAGDTALDLNGWHLTDDAGDLTKWGFPAVTLDAGAYLLVYASNKDRADSDGTELHTNFKLSADGEYLALTDASGTVIHAYAPQFPPQQGDVSYGLGQESASTTLIIEGADVRYTVPFGVIAGWNTVGFDDAGWSQGATGIGYETVPADYQDIIETTVPSGTTSVYIRQAFEVADASTFDELLLGVRFDDGFVAYLNGVRVAGQNDPANPGHNSTATTGHNDPDAVVFQPFDLTDHLGLLQDGTNVLAIHGLNLGSSSDMLIEARLTGETSTLPQPLDEGFLAAPTPGSANGDAFLGFVGDTAFSIDRGFYTAPISVDITSPTLGATIIYTTDGSAPSLTNGTQVAAAHANAPGLASVSISQTTALRAVAMKDGFAPTKIDTQTYLFLADVITSPVLDTAITQDPQYASRLEEAFTDLPSISLTFDDTPSGVEQQTSVEWIAPDGGDGFQVDAGIATFGGEFTNFAKKSFRLYFRGEYGTPKLEFPVFDGFDRGIPAAQSFDQLNLRSGSHDMVMRGFYMSNRFTDDTMLDAGNLAPHGRFVHVYLNGTYWGQYHLRERWNKDFIESYQGVDDDTVESINGNYNVGGWYVGEAYNGDGSGWEHIKSLQNDFEQISQFLNVQNFIDYMLLYMSGNSENEYRTSGVPDGSTLYHFFLNDADGWLRSVGDRTGDAGPPAGLSGPNGIFGSLVSEGHPDFLALLNDRIHALFFNDGALTPAAMQARLQERLDEIENSFIAESARWGYRTPNSWESAADNALNSILPNLTPTMIARLTSRGFLSSVAAPAFSRHGGPVVPGFQLEMTADLLPPSDELILNRPVTQSTNGFGFNGSEAVDGITTNFSHTDTGDLNPWLEVNLQREVFLEQIVVHNRDGLGSRFYNITVEVRDENSNVVYTSPVFNPVAQGQNPTDPGPFLTIDLTGQPGGGVSGHKIRVSKTAVNGSNSSEWLSIGEIEVQGSAVDPSPTGAVIYYTLDGITDPRLPGGTLNPAAQVFQYVPGVPVTITTDTRVRARAFSGGVWSAINEAVFTTAQPADATNLRITELHYHPADPDASEVGAGYTDGDDFEFVELMNTSSQVISLDGVRFSNELVGGDFEGIDFTFGLVTLDPGERIVVVEDANAFQVRYGSSINIAGQYAGKLSNSGETITLRDASGLLIQQFRYEDGNGVGEADWPTSPDGGGPSLVVRDTAGDYTAGTNWKPSTSTHGTPGADEAPGTPGDITGDGYVGVEDLDALLVFWGDSAASSSGAAAADLDHSGTVGSGDLSLVIANFGSGTAPVQPTSNGEVTDDQETPTDSGNVSEGVTGGVADNGNNIENNVAEGSVAQTPSGSDPNGIASSDTADTVEGIVEADTSAPATPQQAEPSPPAQPTRPPTQATTRPALTQPDAAAPQQPGSVVADQRAPSQPAAPDRTVNTAQSGMSHSARQRAAAIRPPGDALALARPNSEPLTDTPTSTNDQDRPRRRFDALALRRK